MKHIYFVNERIRLRAMEPEDLELICEMENDPQQWDISNFTVPYSRYVMKQYMENSQCDMFSDKQLRMMVVRLEDHATILQTFLRCMHAEKWVSLSGKSFVAQAMQKMH